MRGDTKRAGVVWQKAADPDAMVGLVRLALERDDHGTAIRWFGPVLDAAATFPIAALGVAFRD